jgi:SAM-dependent methyltransferase
MTATRRLDALRSCPAGRYEDGLVVVTAGGAAGITAEPWPGGRIAVRHNLRPGELDDDIAEPLAAALAPLADDHEVFARAFTGVVLTSRPDAGSAWEEFYRNSLARLSPADQHGSVEWPGYSEVYRHAMSLLPRTSVADIGCGFGFLALHLAAHGTSVTACDIDPGTARLLRRMAARLGRPVQVVAGDGRGPGPLASVSVDAVALLHVLEHVEEATAGALISEATRVARHRVVVAVPYEAQPTRLFGHLRTINAGQLRKLGAGSGWGYQVHDHHGGWLVLDRPGRLRRPAAVTTWPRPRLRRRRMLRWRPSGWRRRRPRCGGRRPACA